jgi:hypothetical protein
MKKFEYIQICKKYVGGRKNLEDAREDLRDSVLDYMNCLGLEGWDILRLDVNPSMKDAWNDGRVKHGKPDFYEFCVEITGFAKREIEEEDDSDK